MTRLVLMLLEIALAVGVPALIALRAPRRWRLRALALWALTPLLALLAVAGSEFVFGKTSPADLDKLIYGVLLIGSILALPWLIACGAGYAVGAMLRRPTPSEVPIVVPLVTRPEPEPEAISAPVPYMRPPVDPSSPTLAPPSGWQAAHVGFDHDDLMLDGLPVWSLPWREEASKPVTLAHPAHPEQRHEFRIYHVDDGTRATRFAAAELSNTVWGFYRWLVPADAASGTSANGSLRYEHDLGPFDGGRYDAVAPVARLRDTSTEALLFDGSAWASSRIVPQADGSLLLSLEHRAQQTIFRIDPAAGKFRDLVVPAKERPLADLAEAAAAARAACDDPANTYLGRQVAPDGSILVELESAEWSNTHWVRSPRVTEIATGRVLLDLWGTDWDVVVSFPGSRAVRLGFRRYHYGGGAEVEIDLAGDRYVLFEKLGPTSGPLRDLPAALEAAARTEAAAAGPRPLIEQPRITARRCMVALLILVGAIALIAFATLVTLHFQDDPTPRKLDAIPPTSVTGNVSSLRTDTTADTRAGRR